MKDYIVDASVVAKWLLPEPDRSRARLLIATPCHLRAPDLLAPELGNILSKRIARREMTVAEGKEALGLFLTDYFDARVKIIPSRLVASTALRIAANEGRSLYGSLYLALAVQARCRLITADEKFVRGIKDNHLREHIVSLNDPELDLNAN